MATTESKRPVSVWVTVGFALFMVLLGPLLWRQVLPDPTAPSIEWRAVPFAVGGSVFWAAVLVEFVLPMV